MSFFIQCVLAVVLGRLFVTQEPRHSVMFTNLFGDRLNTFEDLFGEFRGNPNLVVGHRQTARPQKLHVLGNRDLTAGFDVQSLLDLDFCIGMIKPSKNTDKATRFLARNADHQQKIIGIKKKLFEMKNERRRLDFKPELNRETFIHELREETEIWWDKTLNASIAHYGEDATIGATIVVDEPIV